MSASDTPWTARSIVELRAALDAGVISAVQLMDAYLQRIELHDDTLRAVLALAPDARTEAARRDAASETIGPLHGIPILIKDNVETRDQPTTAGSLALEHNHTGRDAPLVAALRAAGAIVLGKANLSEWANFRSVRSCSGWSALGGQTRNFQDPTRSPCGSSSGSAVAVAAGLAAAAIGTETDGSIVCPASVNGVVGMKPSVGRISTEGIVPISASQDTAGPLTRSVADAALLLSVLTGEEHAAEPASLEGVRLGVLTASAQLHPGVSERFEQTLALLREAGAVLIEDLDFAAPEDFRRASFEILRHEFKPGLEAYLAGLPNDCRSLTLGTLIEFNEANAERELSIFGQELFVLADAAPGLDAPEYRAALELAQRAARADGIDRLLEQHDVVALITATGAPAWKIDTVYGDRHVGSNATFPAVAGYPHVSVPMGRVRGLPVGLSLIGGRDRDAELLKLAAAVESRLAR